MLDKFREECGIFGVYGNTEAANLTYLGLYALQHRGQEGSGIVSSDGSRLYVEKDMGLVADIFTEERVNRLPGYIAIGHNRYSTTGGSELKNVQPLVVNFALGTMAIAHNGNLVNAGIIKDELEAYGSIFQSTNDSEVIIHLIAQSREATFKNRVIDALTKLKGSYSLLILTEKELIAVRDPNGFRPLCLGSMNDSYVVASESCAFDLIEARFLREIEPGEMVIINHNGIESVHPFPQAKISNCVFEFIYFARPDSTIFGENVDFIRKNLGKQLCHETYVDADIVIPVPDSGVPHALGYAEASKLPFDFGLIRNHYVGRTFIEPQQSIRHFGVKIKLNPVKKVVGGKRVIIVDDSIVRGTTSKKIVKMVREAGAKEVHMRIGSPPTVGPCFYGIDTPTRKELIASTHSIDEIRKYLTADSLGYLSIEGMLKVIPNSQSKFCTACFDLDYPVTFPWEMAMQLELFEGKGR